MQASNKSSTAALSRVKVTIFLNCSRLSVSINGSGINDCSLSKRVRSLFEAINDDFSMWMIILRSTGHLNKIKMFLIQVFIQFKGN